MVGSGETHTLHCAKSECRASCTRQSQRGHKTVRPSGNFPQSRGGQETCLPLESEFEPNLQELGSRVTPADVRSLS